MIGRAAPPDLAAAIQNASAQYGVPVDILTGVWMIEAGGAYPNAYVNSSGYGGLFGTTDWNGPVQEQANYAASILSGWYRKLGSWPAALSKYSGGAYSSVPGQVSGSGTPAGIVTETVNAGAGLTTGLATGAASIVGGGAASLNPLNALADALNNFTGWVGRFAWLLVGIGLAGLGLVLLVFNDFENAGKQAAKVVAANPEVLAAA